MINNLSKIKRDKIVKKINRDLFIASTLIFLLTITINIINITYYPYLLNGFILEINIIITLFCLKSWIKIQKEINILKEKELDIKIRTILYNPE